MFGGIFAQGFPKLALPRFCIPELSNNRRFFFCFTELWSYFSLLLDKIRLTRDGVETVMNDCDIYDIKWWNQQNIIQIVSCKFQW